MKSILITGRHSYIGNSLKEYLGQWPDKYEVSTLPTRGLKPSFELFEGIEVVFCVAGIAHIRETAENRHQYFEVNRDLVIEIARAAKAAGVKQFILLSSMSVYGCSTGHISKNTIPTPNTAYGESKLQADLEIIKLEDEGFKFCCLRPPMVYGKNCTGNYQTLRNVALKTLFFPDYMNQRSMIYIGNLCEFVRTCIDLERRGLFFPQNAEYTNTSEMVRQIAEAHGKHIVFTKLFNWAIPLMQINVIRKVFGNLTYELADTVNKYSFQESIRLTEEE